MPTARTGTGGRWPPVNGGIPAFVGITVAATAALLSAASAAAQEPGLVIEWPYVGAEQARTKYSIAEETAVADVDELEIVRQREPNEALLE